MQSALLGRLRQLWPLLPPAAVALASLFAAPSNSPLSGQTSLTPPVFPIAFYPSGSQEPGQPRFLARGPRFSAVLFPDRVSLTSDGSEVTIRLVTAAGAVMEGRGPLPFSSNHFTGQDSRQWRHEVPMFQTVLYREVWPGIAMTYGASGRTLKSEFVVAPGAEPSLIRLRYEGAVSVDIQQNGELLVTTPTGELREQAPVLFQKAANATVPVRGRFLKLGVHEVGFETGPYDRTATLWIDPVLSFSTYYGGSRSESATALATDSSGNIYMAGWTESGSLTGRFLYPFMGSVDAFVVRFDPSGRVPSYLTYLGGAGDDRALAIDIDAGLGVWITGHTTSTNFPLAGVGQELRRGPRDAFVAQLGQSGTFLRSSTYLGGSESEAGTGIRADPAGGAWVAGETTSPNFPVMSAYQNSFRGQRDAFLVKVNPDGSQAMGTFLGGASDDRATSLTLTTSGVVAGGCTKSSDFPTRSAVQPALSGSQDGFIAAFTTAGDDLRFSTFAGGSGTDCVNALASDAAGNLYAAGSTASTNFPVAGGFQNTAGGGGDGFVVKLGPAGVRQWASYLGGKGVDHAAGIAVDASQRPWVVGHTASANFPVAQPIQAAHAGGAYDAFAVRVESSGAVIGFATYFGGPASDAALAAAVTPSGDLVVAGSTLSTAFPTRDPYQGASRGGIDAFLARITSQ